MLSFRARALGAAVLSAAAAACVLAAPAGAAPDKPFSVVISPGEITQSATVKFQAKFTNLTTNQTLGSARLTVPAGFTVAGASGNTLTLLNLNIAPNSSGIATFTVTVPSCATASGTWGVAAKQSNDFNGTGNDFNLVGANPTTSVRCSGAATQCPPSCAPTATDPVTGASLDVTLDPGSAGVVTINVSGTLDCAGYDELLPTTSFTVEFLPDPNTGGGQKTVTLHIPKSFMHRDTSNGVSFVNMCFEAPFPFVAKGGSPAPQVPPGSGVFRGLLPDCANPPARPCVSARTGEGGGAAITALAPGGDQDPRYGG